MLNQVIFTIKFVICWLRQELKKCWCSFVCRPSVCLVQVCLEQSIIISENIQSIRWTIREQSETTQRAIRALKSESYNRSLKYCVLFFCTYKTGNGQWQWQYNRLGYQQDTISIMMQMSPDTTWWTESIFWLDQTRNKVLLTGVLCSILVLIDFQWSSLFSYLRKAGKALQ